MSNAISVIRIIAGLVACLLIISKQQQLVSIALIIVMASAVLGFLNTFAITKNESKIDHVTHIVSDSIFHLSIFVAFLANQWMSIWLILIIYSREILLPYIQSFGLQSGVYVPDSLMSAKVKMVGHSLSQIVVLTVMLKYIQQPNIVPVALTIATILSAISFIHYLLVVIRMNQQKSA